MAELRHDVPAELEAVIRKCLQKDPAKRYASAGEVADELARWRRGERTLERPPSRVARLGRVVGRRRSAVMAGLVPFALMLALSGGGTPAEPQHRPGPPVVLVGETGLPHSFAWRFNPVDLRESQDDRACEFRQWNGTSLLQLCDHPPAKSYRLTAEVRQGSVRDAATAQVGLYFGHEEWPGAAGQPVHTFFLVSYGNHVTRAARAGGYRPSATFRRASVTAAPAADVPDPTAEDSHTIQGNTFTFDPSRPPPWRRLGVEVTSAGIRAFWCETVDRPPQTLVHIDRDVLAAGYNRELAGRTLRFDAWRPQQPFGVYCRGSMIAVRNVILEPLPE
jgi:hypothetical protein